MASKGTDKTDKKATTPLPNPVKEEIEVIEDDEFEEFEDNMVEGEEIDKNQWEDDWDTEQIDDDFSKQLRAEIESHSAMK
ncbi:DSS1/SEM1 family protein [Tieghemostelium lacteum]|uniref:DSS1/SEM1 family protein n=1 Tax=Tieghemostelium lacteum TaxID=361077 RepID=A0A151Z5X5_TIELA|nr:DSS1/SEM1 family protein [Tieghemostelium lacteum]|eukprot:KYQ89359.1 DSS1/SEM1 family protein [Tieghemostelium lacteum]